MISIIICSRFKEKADLLAQNIAATINLQHEIIIVDNNDNRYSIFEAYNRGVGLSKYPYLCFVHEDVLFHSINWGEMIVNHLKLPQVGICGLAGRDFVTRIPASWKVKLPAVNIIQSYPGSAKHSKKRFVPKNFQSSRRNVVILDGVLLCMKKEIFGKLKFDEELKGFHGYDLDICLQAVVLGLKNYVIYDVELEHFSKGNPDAFYYRNLIKIYKKWENHLPVMGENTPESITASIHRIETKGLSKLLKKLVRRKFSSSEIIDEIGYFTRMLNLKNENFILKTLHAEVIAVKFLFYIIFNLPAYGKSAMYKLLKIK